MEYPDDQPVVESSRLFFEELKDSLVSMTQGLGDGLVTVNSTRLPDLPHITVKGTHRR